LQNAIDDLQPDIICLQETFLTPTKQARIKNYQYPPPRKDRIDRDGGGVMIFVHKSIPTVTLNFDSVLEATAVQIVLSQLTLTLCSLYLPPDITSSCLIHNLDALISYLPKPFLILTDANAHHPSWGSLQSDRKGNTINEWLNDRGLTLLNTGEPTFLSAAGTFSHIDITIATPDIASIFTWHVHHDSYNSDHFPIMIDSSLNFTNNVRPHWLLLSADWKGFQDSLSLPSTFLSPSQACGSVTSSLIMAAQKNIPQSKGNNFAKSNCWWNKDCAHAKCQKNKALTQYRNHLGDIERWIAFKKARAIFRKTILHAQRTAWQNFLQTITSKTSSAEVWRKVRALRGPFSTPNITLKLNGNAIAEPEKVADSLAYYFSKKSDGTSSDPLFMAHRSVCELNPIVFPPDQTEWYNQPLQLYELERALSTSKSKSPGPDNIPFAFLHHLSSNQQLSLLSFYNYVYVTGFPHQWREAVVIPILKAGKPSSDVSSYRPISLTNCLCKLLEKMLNWRLQAYLERRSFYDPCQSGFRSRHSTLDGLARLETSIKDSLLLNKFCVAIFLDISKAFDSVWHYGLVQKLKGLGLIGNLPIFIQQFLQLRRICVRVSSTTSNRQPLYCGVPQGSVLSPTLFSILINDLFALLPPLVSHSLYADDGALWITGQNLTECLTTMQSALDSVVKWSHKWGLQISPLKTKAIIFTRRHTPQNLSLLLADAQLDFVASTTFLGMIFDRRLTWGPHISSLHARCSGDLRLMSVLAARKWGADFESLKRIYISLIRPKLDYSSFLYSTAAPSHLIKLDRIQYAALRIILGVLRCTPTCLLEAEANIMPLTIRRNVLLTRYTSRILSIKHHPLHTLALSYSPVFFPSNAPHLLPVTGRMHNEFLSLNFSLTETSVIPIELGYYSSQLPVYSSLSMAPKAEYSASTWKILFHNLLETQYNEHTAVYTDGSVQNSCCGCAVWNSSFTIMSRLPSSTSIYTCELYGIYCALKFIASRPGKFVIFTDSLSCIKSLQQPLPVTNYLISWIIHTFESIPKNKIVLEWVPSHTGIQGNEAADALALRSLKLQTITGLPPTVDDQRRQIISYYSSLWQTHWTNQSLHYTEYKPLLGPPNYSNLSRPEQVAITRLRLQTCNFTHGHYFTKTPRPNCTICHCPMTIQHLLLVCPNYQTQRTPLVQTCKTLNKPFKLSTLLSNSYPTDLLLIFLRDTQYANKI
jgi:ribonuclease HI